MTKPFKLDNLKKVSKQDIELVNALYEYLPSTDVREKLQVGIRKMLIKHLGNDVRYFISSVERKEFRDFVLGLPEFPVVASLSLTPVEKKGIAFIDYNIAGLFINKLLGGAGEVSGELRSLTETEQGVLQYLIMQVLSQIYNMVGSEPRVHFRFEGFLDDIAVIEKVIPQKEKVSIITIEVSVSDHSGFVKIVLPDPFLQSSLAKTVNAGTTKNEREYFARRIKKWDYIKIPVWAEAGNATILGQEIRELEEGDVILFDDVSVHLIGGNVSGDVTIHFGQSEKGVIARLTNVDKKEIKCMLMNVAGPGKKF